MLAAKLGLCVLLFVFIGELLLLSQHLGEGAEHISGSILDGMSIDKSQFVSTQDTSKYNILTAKKRTILFYIKLTNSTGTNIHTGNISLAFQHEGQYIADPVITTFDLANGTSKLVTIAWKPSIDLDSASCTVLVTAYDAANDQLGFLKEPLTIA
jgi:hypothetical protein